MRNDWETPPTVEGLIVRAWIGEDGQPDVLHVQGVDVADDIGNLNRVIGDPDNPDPDSPFVLVGKAGTIAQHGYRCYGPSSVGLGRLSAPSIPEPGPALGVATNPPEPRWRRFRGVVDGWVAAALKKRFQGL